MAKYLVLLVSDELGDLIRDKLIPSGDIHLSLAGHGAGVPVDGLTEIDFLSRAYPTTEQAKYAARRRGVSEVTNNWPPDPD